MMDAIVYFSDYKEFIKLLNYLDSPVSENSESREKTGMEILVESFSLSTPVNNDGALCSYIRVAYEELDLIRDVSVLEVLSESAYTGTGTADRVYQGIKNDPKKLAIYESVYDTKLREVSDGEGGITVYTPPFKFGMLAESDLPIPASVTSRQGMQQLIISGLDEQVEAAIDSIEDVIQRKLTLAWFHRATDWERDNQQFIALFQALGLTDEQADNHMRAAAQL